jgi:3'-5' exoribonuclease 1
MNYIIFDLEATCWKVKRDRSEIIEIGAVKTDEHFNLLDAFDTFVKPTVDPKLSTFCTELTHITQDDVDNAPLFHQALQVFEEWAGEDVYFISWGGYDKRQIYRESKLKLYKGPILRRLNRHIDLKQLFAAITNTKRCGLKRALNKLGIPFHGIHHRAIWDAYNVASIGRSIHKSYDDFLERFDPGQLEKAIINRLRNP